MVIDGLAAHHGGAVRFSDAANGLGGESIAGELDCADDDAIASAYDTVSDAAADRTAGHTTAGHTTDEHAGACWSHCYSKSCGQHTREDVHASPRNRNANLRNASRHPDDCRYARHNKRGSNRHAIHGHAGESDDRAGSISYKCVNRRRNFHRSGHGWCGAFCGGDGNREFFVSARRAA